MNFMDNLKQEVKTKEASQLQMTENGALGFVTSGKDLLDLNFRVASYRGKPSSTVVNDFNKAFHWDKNLAVKWLFFARDAREGLGERDLFLNCFRSLLNTHKSDKIKTLIKFIPEFGRWKDIFCVFGTDYENIAISLIKNQLEEDIRNVNSNKPCSLLAKWMPRENTSSKDRVKFARYLTKKLGYKPSQYRKILSKLNKHLGVVEVPISANKIDEINYEHVPSLANIKYRNLFLKKDEERRREYLGKLEKGEAKINMSVGFPHDIVHAYSKGALNSWGNYDRNSFVSHIDATLEAAWKALPSFELSNTIVVGDSSGSMTVSVGNSTVTAIEVAHSLGIYCGDHNTGAFKNKMITFSENPKYLEWKDNDTLAAKLQIAFSHSEVANTNIERVFHLILNTAIKNHCAQEDMPKNILIVSDMEFDSATSGRKDITLFDNIKQKFEENNYVLPRLIFWNVNSRTGTVPMQQNDSGVALVSGFSVNIVKMVTSGKLDPLECLIEQLNVERYKDILWE